jgi:flagella basal body P-ring formation protein FlgA
MLKHKVFLLSALLMFSHQATSITRPLQELAHVRLVQEAHGEQNHSVLNVHDDVSAGATKQLPRRVEFSKRSNLEQIEQEVAHHNSWQEAVILPTNSMKCKDVLEGYEIDPTLPSRVTLQCGSEKVAAIVYEAIMLPVAVDYIKAGDVITEEMLSYRKFTKKSSMGAIQDVSIISEMVAKSSIQPHKPIQKKQLSEPIMVKKGQSVTIVYARHNLTIEMPAVAQQNGSKGQVIKIKQQNNNILFAKVINPDTVLVQE